MAISFDRTPSATAPQPIELKLEPTRQDIQPYDILADKEETVRALRSSPEIDVLTENIDLSDLSTIVTFGAESAENISKASDVVLRSMNMQQVDETGHLMQTLSKIMSGFDPEEFKGETSLLGRLFGNVRKRLDAMIAKYDTLGAEVDKIYVQLRSYEDEITRSNTKLEEMFHTNVEYFHELEKYIVAGEQACREIEDYLSQRRAEYERTGDTSLTFEIQSLENALTMMEQRTQDLRTAETVALQSIPLIRMMQVSNLNLIRKINSAFIITLPVFKQALAQAIMLKRQKIQAESMDALDKQTNEMLRRNAANTVKQAKMTTQLVSGSSIKAETLETTWKEICTGIEETRKIEESARAKRMQDQQKLEAIQADFRRRFGDHR